MYGPLPGGFCFEESSISIQCKFSRVLGRPDILPDFRIVFLEESLDLSRDYISAAFKGGPIVVKGFAAGIHIFQLAVYYSIRQWVVGWRGCLERLDHECGIKVSLSSPKLRNIYVFVLFAAVTWASFPRFFFPCPCSIPTFQA